MREKIKWSKLPPLDDKRWRRLHLKTILIERGLASDDWVLMGRPGDSPEAGLHNIPPLYGGKTPKGLIADKLLHGPCEVMILGPGVGVDLAIMRDSIQETLSNPKLVDGLAIDVFGLTKTLGNPARRVVRHDYSGTKEKPTTFEFYENPQLLGKYDVVVGQSSVGVHTESPQLALIKSAGLLKPGGVAFIEYAIYEHMFEGLPADEKRKKIERIFHRFLSTRPKQYAIQSTFTKKEEDHHPHRDLYWAIIKRKK